VERYEVSIRLSHLSYLYTKNETHIHYIAQKRATVRETRLKPCVVAILHYHDGTSSSPHRIATMAFFFCNRGKDLFLHHLVMNSRVGGGAFLLMGETVSAFKWVKNWCLVDLHKYKFIAPEFSSLNVFQSNCHVKLFNESRRQKKQNSFARTCLSLVLKVKFHIL
jgi:hypothetical protein